MSGIKKLMHKVKDKMHIDHSVGQQDQQTEGHFSKDAWPGVEQGGSAKTGAPHNVRQGAEQTTAPISEQPTAFPEDAAHKATDASRLADAPPTFQENKMAPTSDFSGGSNFTPKVMTGEHPANTDALGKSPVYSPLGSSAHENVASAKPNVTDVGATTGTNNVTPSTLSTGTKGAQAQQPFSGSLPHVGETQQDPKLHTKDADAVSSKTGAGAPNPMTHIRDVDYSPGLTTANPLPSAIGSGTGAGSHKPGLHVDELKDAKAKAGSAVNRSPDLTGDINTLGAPAQRSDSTPKPIVGYISPPYTGAKDSHVDELKDAKAKAGSSINRSPDLTGDIDNLGAPAHGGDKDLSSALDKIADDKAETGKSGAGAAAGTGILSGAADYVHSGARSVADTVHQYTGAGSDNKSLGDKAGDSGQMAADKARAAGQTVTDTAAQGTKTAQDALTPDQETSGTKTFNKTPSGKRVTTPADDKSYMQQAKEGIAAAAAVTAEKASQAYQVVSDKAYETGIPQKLGEHANTASDAATSKYNDLATGAQNQHAAVREVAGDRLASAKAQAQDYAQSAQQKAVQHFDRLRNASPEDINHSNLGRMVGGIALLWLASYAIGIPFKYGLAGAILAVSAVLFAEWDQGNRARRARGHTGTTSAATGTGTGSGVGTGIGAGTSNSGTTTSGPEGSDSISKLGTMGGIDAKMGAPPSSIHETSIGDISSGAKQNFPQDPVSHGIGGISGHGSHGTPAYGGSGLGSDSGAGPTVSAGGLGQSAGAKAGHNEPFSFYHSSGGASYAPPASNDAHAQSARGTVTDAGFDSTYRTTEPTHKVERLQPTHTEKSKYVMEE